MVNTKHTKKVLKKIREFNGMSITELVNETKLKRCQVRECLAFLEGAERINVRSVGMTKLHYEA